MPITTVEEPTDCLEQARLKCIEKFSKHLTSEMVLAKNGDGFFERRYYEDYLNSKYAHQNAMNEFYNMIHDLSK